MFSHLDFQLVSQYTVLCQVSDRANNVVGTLTNSHLIQILHSECPMYMNY